MLKVLYQGAGSACFELENRSPYYAPSPYSVYLDGALVLQNNTNVFSLFGLSPNTHYTLCVKSESAEETLDFSTACETCAVNARDFGAIGDGVHDDTDALALAIRCLPEDGRLILPEGRYLTRPQMLKSRMTLELQSGAVLLGSPERERYPILPGAVIDPVTGKELIFGADEGLVKPMYQSLLTAQYAEDIAIIGPGTVDGNAGAGDFWTKYHEFPAARPRLFFFNHCARVRLHGVRVKDSPAWQIHPFFCDDVGIYNVTVTAPKDSPNTDAIDPESCRGVEILGCRLNVGDDCIAIKSGKIELGKKYRRAAEGHTIRNCLMEHGHGAVTLGSETAAGVRDLAVSQCLFRDTDRGLRIKTRRGRGKDCEITGITFENIRMDGVLTPIVMNMWYNCVDPDRESEYVWTRKALPVDERTPHLGSFVFRNLECTGAHAAACSIDGLPERPIDAVTLEDISVSFAENALPAIPAMRNFAEPVCRMGLYFENVGKIRLKNVRLSGVVGDAVITKACGALEQENLEVR